MAFCVLAFGKPSAIGVAVEFGFLLLPSADVPRRIDAPLADQHEAAHAYVQETDRGAEEASHRNAECLAVVLGARLFEFSVSPMWLAWAEFPITRKDRETTVHMPCQFRIVRLDDKRSQERDNLSRQIGMCGSIGLSNFDLRASKILTR